MPNPRPTRDRSFELPERATTLDEHEYSPHDDLWQFGGAQTATFDFTRLRQCCGTEFLDTLKAVLVHALRNGALPTAQSLYFGFAHFAEHEAKPGCLLTRITKEDFINSASRSSGEFLAIYTIRLRALVNRWRKLRLPGIEPALLDWLKTWKPRNPPKGRIALSNDPDEGAFTDAELISILTALGNSLSEDSEEKAQKTQPYDFLVVILLLLLGTRPVQLAHTKIKDFKVQRADGAPTVYWLNLPRGKQKKQKYRTQQKLREIPEKIIGDMLDWWVSEVKDAYRATYPQSDQSDRALEELPIFPRAMKTSAKGQSTRAVHLLFPPLSPMQKMPKNTALHASPKSLEKRIERVFNRLALPSARTNGLLKVTARRFRHTLATRAAEQGYGVRIIAEWLDHSTLETAWMYVRATPKFIRRISKALDPRLAKRAGLFLGKIIPNEEAAPRFNGSPIPVANTENGKCVGNCGKFGRCDNGNAAPLSCYRCKRFYPLLDAPHEEILDMLLRRRKEYMDTDPTNPLATAYDDVILALYQLIDEISEIKAAGGKA